MRIADEVLKCVAFIGEVAHRDDSGVSGDLHATGFIVAVPCESPGMERLTTTYCVTAKHVALDLKDREIYLLVNRAGGGVTTIPQIGERWWLHPSDKTADVAVVQVGGVQSGLDLRTVIVKNLVTADTIRKFDIGVGDEVFMTGLFTAAPGVKRNLPIVRHGNIAMMPSEQIQTELGYADVYLVEARSIGGISGSPVFVRLTVLSRGKLADGSDADLFAPGHGAFLLGLAQGHWDIQESEMNKPFFTHDGKRGVNMGIAIVVPAIKILETLYRPELILQRKQQEEELLRRHIPATDSAKRREEMSKVFTQADFEAALEKANRKV
jgi:hypothetical protein